MTLSGVRVKQRISSDPQNSGWKNDTSKFGLLMLQKMGWTEGKGLGKNEDGRLEHLRVPFKTDTLGLGADKKNIDNWLQTRVDFDALLSRINAGEVEGRVEGEVEGEVEDGIDGMEKKEKDRKRKEDGKKNRKKDREDGKDGKDRKDKKDRKDRKDRKDKKDKKDKKEKDKSIKKKKSKKEAKSSEPVDNRAPERLSFKRKLIRGKQVDRYSSQDLNEILGIKRPAV